MPRNLIADLALLFARKQPSSASSRPSSSSSGSAYSHASSSTVASSSCSITPALQPEAEAGEANSSGSCSSALNSFSTDHVKSYFKLQRLARSAAKLGRVGGSDGGVAGLHAYGGVAWCGPACIWWYGKVWCDVMGGPTWHGGKPACHCLGYSCWLFRHMLPCMYACHVQLGSRRAPMIIFTPSPCPCPA